MARKPKAKQAEPEPESNNHTVGGRKAAEFGAGAVAKAMGKTPGEVRSMLRGDEELVEKYKSKSGWDFGSQKIVDRVAKDLSDKRRAAPTKKAA